MAEEKIYLTTDEILNKTLGPQIFQIMAEEKIYLTTDKTLSKSTSGKTIKIMVEEKITTQTNKPSNKNLEPEVKETPLPKTRAVKPTPTPSRRVTVEQKSNIDRSSDTKSEIRPTPTPERRSRWSSFFSRSSGRAVGMDSTPEEAPSTNGSCNSPGNDGLALLSMILLPIIFRSKSIFKPKKN